MKLLTAFLFSLAIVASSYAQTNLWQNSGNIGIGTTTPGAQLTLLQNSNVALRLDTSSSVVTARNWAIANSCYAYGDLGFLQSNTLGGDPLNAGIFRIYFSPNGNVGIGTTSPSEKLTIYGMANAQPGVLSLESSREDAGGVEAGRISGKNSGNEINRISFYRGGGSATGSIGFWTKQSNGSSLVESLRIADTGDVGIGTLNPEAKLQVLGGGFFVNSVGDNVGGLYYGGSSFGLLVGKYSTSPWPGPNGLFIGGNGLIMGNVGIGTTSPTEKLSVKGKIRAQEVIVETTGWSDHVFADSYELQSLAEVEQHIKAEKHLPGVPSAQEVAEKGVSVGDMQAVLLAKLEEVTLHLIAQEKELAALRAKVSKLETEKPRQQ